MRKYISIFRLVLRRLLVARKENSTGFSTGLTGRSKNLDPTGRPTGFHLCSCSGKTKPFLTLFDRWRKLISKSSSSSGPLNSLPTNFLVLPPTVCTLPITKSPCFGKIAIRSSSSRLTLLEESNTSDSKSANEISSSSVDDLLSIAWLGNNFLFTGVNAIIAERLSCVAF